MLGEVVSTPDVTITEQVRLTDCLLKAIRDVAKVVVPPLPRYMFGGCCKSLGHSTNTSDTDHPTKTLANHIRQRKCITQLITLGGQKKVKVLDFVGVFCADQSPPENKAEILRHFTANDNVHLTPAGYSKLADKITEESLALLSHGIVALAGTHRKDISNRPPRVWRGFVSTPGFGRVSDLHKTWGRGRMHPYKC